MWGDFKAPFQAPFHVFKEVVEETESKVCSC